MIQLPKFTSHKVATMLIVGATAGAGAACVFVAARFASDPGDILGFFGGAIGAGLAVVGALWLEERKRIKSVENSRGLYITSLTQLALSAHEFSRAADDDVPSRLLTFRQTARTFDEIKRLVSFEDAGAYFSICAVIYWIEVFEGEAKVLLERLDRGELTSAQVKAAIAPRLTRLAPAIRGCLGAHPYWKGGQARLDLLLRLADQQAATMAQAPSGPVPNA